MYTTRKLDKFCTDRIDEFYHFLGMYTHSRKTIYDCSANRSEYCSRGNLEIKEKV